MILNVIIFKNLKIGAFTTPQFIDVAPEDSATQLERSLIFNIDDESVRKKFGDLEMYYIGKFDDQTGKFVQDDVRLLLSCRDIILANYVPKKVRKSKKKEVQANA